MHNSNCDQVQGTLAPDVPIGSVLTHYDFATFLGPNPVATDADGIDLKRK